MISCASNTQNVVLTNAISGAIEMSCAVLSNPGQNILLPSPGFGLYKCHAESRGVKVRLYSLLVKTLIHCVYVT